MSQGSSGVFKPSIQSDVRKSDARKSSQFNQNWRKCDCSLRTCVLAIYIHWKSGWRTMLNLYLVSIAWARYYVRYRRPEAGLFREAHRTSMHYKLDEAARTSTSAQWCTTQIPLLSGKDRKVALFLKCSRACYLLRFTRAQHSELE